MCACIYMTSVHAYKWNTIHHRLLVPPVKAIPHKYKYVYTYIWIFTYDRFNWKCHIPEVLQIQKIRFLGISRYKFKLRFGFHLNSTKKFEFRDLVDFGGVPFRWNHSHVINTVHKNRFVHEGLFLSFPWSWPHAPRYHTAYIFHMF